MREYLLSVIIPTKNRQYYCLEAVKQILSLKINNLEICIQDNSDEDILQEEIKALNSNQIVYNYHQGVLSFVDNFSEAVSLGHGLYFCMIGDDDGILPQIMELTAIAKEKNLEAVIPALNFVYYWPSNANIVEDSEKGVLQANVSSESSCCEVFTNHDDLLKLLRNAAQNYTSLNIPRLYHGIVKKSVLDIIKEKTGRYFGGLTPDMYMAASLSLVCKNIMRVDYSVTISGICPTSGSSDSATGKHTGELKDAPHFRGHDKYQWDEAIPTFYSVDTIWGDTLLHALHDFQREDITEQFNLPLFEGVCIAKYPAFKGLILEHAKSHNIDFSTIRLTYMVWKFKRRIISLYHRVSGKVVQRKTNKQDQRIVGIRTISEAENFITNHLNIL